jgi:hypothetical protein
LTIPVNAVTDAGAFWVVTMTAGGGATVLVGLPLSAVNNVVRQLVLVEAIVGRPFW